MRKMMATLLAGAMLMMAVGTASAIPYGFHEITSNSPINVASQLFVDVSAAGSSTAFTFTNTAVLQSSITDIYFDFGNPFPLNLPPSLTSSSGVDFSIGASPSNLPSGNTIAFTAGFGADSNSPTAHNGIDNSNEYLTITFSGLSFSQIITAFNDETFRIGVHVQSLSDGQSESYVTPGTPVPEPGTMMLLGIGMLGLAVYGKRRMNKDA
jgi:hypothetical protein